MTSNQSRHAAAQRRIWLVLRAARGELVTYSAGSYSVEVVAVKTRPTVSKLDAGEGFAISSRAWDWLIGPDELVDASGNELEPKAGHKITAADDSVYRLTPGPSGDGVPFTWSDAFHTWRRVNTESES